MSQITEEKPEISFELTTSKCDYINQGCNINNIEVHASDFVGLERCLITHKKPLGKYLLILMKDITQEKELQREAATQSYSDIIFATISHELKTPLNIIMNCISCLSSKVQNTEKKWVEMI